MLTSLIIAMITGAGGALVSGEVALVAEGFQFTEGPVWLPGGMLIFSDIPADRIYGADKTVFREPSGQSNGLTLDRAGRLIAAEHRNRRISRTEADGTVTVAADRYEGKRFNSPNAVVVRSEGMIFFTDPPYGLEGGLGGPNADLDFSGVFAVSPKGEVRLLARDFKKPNGLAFSPDEKTLYIADTEGEHIRAFDVSADGTLSNGRVFCEIPHPDGMKVDAQGNVWSTAGDGVRAISPEGKLIETIKFPAIPSNCAFGDTDYKTLYVTARQGLYKVRLNVAGIPPQGAPARKLP